MIPGIVKCLEKAQSETESQSSVIPCKEEEIVNQIEGTVTDW